MNTATCPACKKVFTKKQIGHKFCSHRCRKSWNGKLRHKRHMHRLREKGRERYWANHQAELERSRKRQPQTNLKVSKWKKEHPERYREHTHRYYDTHRTQIAARQRAYRATLKHKQWRTHYRAQPDVRQKHNDDNNRRGALRRQRRFALDGIIADLLIAGGTKA